MEKYQKIQTVYKRDPDTNFKTLLEGEYSIPEFEYLAGNLWYWREKVDGTNIRIRYIDGKISFEGKTDDADIPAKLVNTLMDIFLPKLPIFNKIFDGDACLYGEGYGAGVHKGGGKYSEYPAFVLFDVNIDGWWLQQKNIADISDKLDINRVPIIGEGTLHEMVEYARDGITSTWGDFPAEGIVALPAVEMNTRSGNRIITKIKSRDFILPKQG